MGLGAIVVVGAEREDFCSNSRQGERLFPHPLAYVDVLGRSMVDRTVERFSRADVETVTVLAAESSGHVPVLESGLDQMNFQVVSDLPSAIAQQLSDYSSRGIEHSFVVSGSIYVETDLVDMFYFHREARQAVTRTLDSEGPMDLSLVDCAKAQHTDLESLFTPPEETSASYFIRDYVSRLKHPRDLRRIASDALCGRSAIRPSGREIKPGIWIDDGADVRRRARIVAPAYIGRGSTVQEDTLITRFSSIEKDCYVDCGTVIESSLVLPNTYIGICLDVCHAVASGSKLLSLGHEVLVEISDPSVMRSNGSIPQEMGLNRSHHEEQPIVADLQQTQPPASETWQLGADTIQG